MKLSLLLFSLLLFLLWGCGEGSLSNTEDMPSKKEKPVITKEDSLNGVLLKGNGYVYYHIYPDVGTCYRGEVDFREYDKMIAAVSSSIHSHFDNSLATRDFYVKVTAIETGESVVVAAIDKGGVKTNDFFKKEQHIMDISQEAFTKLDIDGAGYKAGRIYVTWEIFEKK